MGANTVTGNVVVSDDSTLATSTITAVPSSPANRFDIHLFLANGGQAGNFAPNFPLRIPFVGGRNIYVAVSTGTTVFLYLEDLEVSAE